MQGVEPSGRHEGAGQHRALSGRAGYPLQQPQSSCDAALQRAATENYRMPVILALTHSGRHESRQKAPQARGAAERPL
jgi:hypothetical protein